MGERTVAIARFGTSRGLRAPRTRTLLLVALAAAACGGGSTPVTTAAPFTPVPPGTRVPVYIHYYLFWTVSHWHDRLGPQYPYDASPPPAPGAMDEHGCNPTVRYPGAAIVDVPAEGLYDQSAPQTYDRHIADAARAGITGFLVSWQGTGEPGQSPSSSGYDQRLDLMVRRTDAYLAAHPGGFSLGLAFASYGQYDRPAAQVTADLLSFAGRYGTDPAFHNRFSPLPLVMWLDSRKAPVETVRAVAAAVRGKVFLVGDETAASWARDADSLDGTSYYWSTEDPVRNPSAGSTLATLAGRVHAVGKPWFAPFIAGYDKQLAGGGCVPRDGLDTLHRIWSVNAATRPDAWFGISWNEFVENTYLEPSVTYGTRYLDEVGRLASGD